ncbi:MAG: DUF2807 domain-containing protein [Alistipes sp.]|nr:DUF2807 domain-containing protein [Alistipes sp.]
MKRIILTFAAVAALLSAAAQDTSSNQWLPEFTEVKVSAAIDIRFVRADASEAPRIVYDTGGSDEGKFRAEVKKGVLTISEKITLDKRSNTSATVYYHSLESISLAGAYAQAEGTLAEKMLTLKMSDGARLEADIEIVDLEAELSGKESQMKLSGSVRYLELDASSGRIDAAGLDVTDAEITASHGANVTVTVTERLKASASTSATLIYHGEPQIIKQQRSAIFGGSIKAAK